nr:hypothetical protein [Deltaproteobacteria bacterium]
PPPTMSTRTTDVSTSGSSGTPTSADDGNSSSGEPAEDPCLQFPTTPIFDMCPEGCQGVPIGELFDAETCEWDRGGAICVSASEPASSQDYVPAWIEIDGQVYGTGVGVGCIVVQNQPSMLSECTGGPGDHPICHCLGVDLSVMLSCDFPSDCPAVEVYEPATFPESDCALQALRDHTPAELSFFVGGNLAGARLRVFVHEDGTVTVASRVVSDTSCFDPAEPSVRCVIESPAYFDQCMAITDEQDKEACLDPESWQLNCVSQTADCE